MSGVERTREFRNVRLRIMDVDPGGDMGYIAIAEDVETVNVSRLKMRYYK
jgi:hypothetical protein